MLNTHTRIFVATLFLMMISVVFVFSTGFFNYGGQKSPYEFLYHQFLFSLVGISIICAMQFMSKKTCYNLMIVMFLVALIACAILPLLPTSLVVETKGARRWIRVFGFSLAPLEFLKIGAIYLLALTYSRRIYAGEKSVVKECVILLPTVLIYIILFWLIYSTQNDLGQCVLIAMVLIFMAFRAGVSYKLFFSLILASVLAIILIILISPRRLQRILDWWGGAQDFFLLLFPENIQEILRVSNSEMPYQIFHSINAIYNGGFVGRGFGLGVFKLGFLSEVHTDFILAGIAEEIGFLGFIGVGIIFVILILSIFRLAVLMKNKKDHLFCYGIGICLMISFFMNLGGIISFIPLKGIAVPFLSYGGSSMIANSIGIGAILCIFKNAGENKELDIKI